MAQFGCVDAGIEDPGHARRARSQAVKKRLSTVAGLSLAAALGCATTPSNHQKGPPLTVRVSNESWAVSAVYLVSGGVMRRISTTPALSTELVRLSFGALDDSRVTLLVRQIGEKEEFRSQPLLVPPGGRVDLTIGTLLRASRAAVF